MNPTERILSHFEQISSIPRGTKHEDQIRAWLQDWAASRGYASRTDTAGNLVVQVPASPGYENHPVLVLQGHMDMVWQKTPDSDHDFTRDPIRLIREGEWIKADKTTLGADNGIAIALMMALVEDENVVHPALELLFTVEEEFGLVGAATLDPAMLTGKTLLNLDSEKEGELTIGCAGGGSVNITLPVTWERQSGDQAAFELEISGLRGGHSGVDIHKHRASANKIIGRVLDSIQRESPIRLSALKGGSVRNAIARDAVAVFVCSKNQAALCQQTFAEISQALLKEYAQSEPGLTISLIEHIGEPASVISLAETTAGIRLLVALPYGVLAMSADIPGFVETSTNLGVLELKESGLYLVSSYRSAVFARLVEMVHRAEAIAWLAGAKAERTSMTQPWQPNMESPLLQKCVETYQALFGEKPVVKLIHAGLECGLISERCGGLDAISLGPTVKGAHSPDERLYIPSLPGTWAFLVELLAL